MKLLLDTHIWLWSLLAPENLSRKVARALQDRANELWLSPISIWESLLLAEKGRIRLNRPAHEWIREALAKMPTQEAPITHDIALASRTIELPHADPADRFLAATARILNLTLVTADGRLLKYHTGNTLPNRD